MIRFLSVCLILYALFGFHHSPRAIIGIDLSGVCDKVNFNCQCGTPGYTFQVPIKQCHTVYRWQFSCKPCGDLKEGLFCSKYASCLGCAPEELNKCLTCPRGKFGEWCTADCECHNGATCNRDGSCTCPTNFEGVTCEISKVSEIVKPTCPDPGAPQNGAAIGNGESPFNPGSSITFSCSEGHVLIGANSIVCTESGSWSAPNPTCNAICPTLEPPSNGRVGLQFQGNSKSDERVVSGTQAIFSCNGLFQLAGAQMSLCNDDGSWSASVPTCNRLVACPTPEDPINGKAIVNMPIQSLDGSPQLPAGWLAVGTQTSFLCKNFYEIVGPTERTCLPDGVWSGQDPRCAQICGKSVAPRTPTVANGNASDIGEWPWMAQILQLNRAGEWDMMCGATLVNDQWLLTAAHCVTSERSFVVVDKSDLQVKLGKHYLDREEPEWSQVKQVRTIVVHPQYNPISLDSDAALLLMETPAEFTARVQPVCLPDRGTSFGQTFIQPESVGVVTGWGLTEQGRLSRELQKASIPVASRQNCEADYRALNITLTVTDSMFCAGLNDAEVRACRGDSGGPMVFESRSVDNSRWIQGGVVSWGGPGTCENPRHYNGFTRVDLLLNWIFQFIRI